MTRPLATCQLACVLFVLCVCSSANAQYWGGGWGGGYHSSTLEEGIQRGYADVVRSRGMANLMNSEAAKNFEDARSKYLDNRLQATQTYFEMRRYNQEARRAERSTPLANEQYVRLARAQAPARLSVSQLDPFTGKITWPAALQREKYSMLRNSIDALFAARATGTTFADDEIGVATDAFLAEIKADIDSFRPMEYVAARNFLISLAFESRQPPQ